MPNLLTNRFHPEKAWPVCGRLCCVPIAWAFVAKVGIPWMFTEWIRGLMGYEAKSFVWMQRSVKRKNIPTPGTLPSPGPPCHWVASPANWGTLEATEWALARAQLWSGQHWKHTHVHMHHTNGEPSRRPPRIFKRTALASGHARAWSCGPLCCFRAISPYHPHIITQPTERRQGREWSAETC